MSLLDDIIKAFTSSFDDDDGDARDLLEEDIVFIGYLLARLLEDAKEGAVTKDVLAILENHWGKANRALAHAHTEVENTRGTIIYAGVTDSVRSDVMVPGGLSILTTELAEGIWKYVEGVINAAFELPPSVRAALGRASSAASMAWGELRIRGMREWRADN